MGKNNLLGSWGEALAAELLRKKGYQIIAQNYRSRFGEIDLIAQNKKFLAFVEVKLRKTDKFGEAKEFVGAAKQEKLRLTAAVWLEEHESRLQPRFDVVEIYAPLGTDTKNPVIHHIENAFTE